jgi:hypothetical protein
VAISAADRSASLSFIKVATLHRSDTCRCACCHGSAGIFASEPYAFTSVDILDQHGKRGVGTLIDMVVRDVFGHSRPWIAEIL